jgi:hypothetical protein
MIGGIHLRLNSRNFEDLLTRVIFLKGGLNLLLIIEGYIKNFIFSGIYLSLGE